MADNHNIPTTEESRERMITAFLTQVTPSFRELARTYLEDRQWDLDATVSAYNEATATILAARNAQNPIDPGVFSAPNLGFVNPLPSSPSLPPLPQQLLLLPPDPSGSYSNEQWHDYMPLSCEILNVQPEPEVVPSNITVWRNGLTFNYISLKPLDDPETAQFLQYIESLEPPRIIESRDGKLRFLIELVRRQDEDFVELPSVQASFDSVSFTPVTTIMLRLADGTRFVSVFRTHQTIRDIRNFVDAVTPGDSRGYQLLHNVEFPPYKPLTELDQTIEQAGISNSLLIQKF